MKDQEPKLNRQQRKALERGRGTQRANIAPTISLAESRLIQHSDIIERESKKRGILPNRAENRLWESAPLIQEPSEDSFHDKMADMLHRLEQSQNPHLQTVAEDFVRLRDKGILKIQALPGNPNMVMGAEISRNDERTNVELRLILSTAGISQINHPFNLASSFAHEIEHLRDIEEFDHGIQGLPLDERLARHWERSTQPLLFRQMEARATGAQYEALIHHFGMIQAVPEYIPLKQVEFVADYISIGCDPESQRWLDTISRHEREGFVSTPRTS